MPGGDRTGPAGMGPMTGRAAGYCTGNSYPGFASPHPPGFSGRRGFSRMGRGRVTVIGAKGLPVVGKPGKQVVHGVAEARVLLVQSQDARANTPDVSLVLEANGKYYSFPEKTWDELGVPHEWLRKQVDLTRHPLRSWVTGKIEELLAKVRWSHGVPDGSAT